ncbi:NUDIX hydrolase [Rhodoplanes sp.]|uniref:NUDIX hydrolase n=1 Tax=Rhodoplanes sp. TaxID=1968906 RepID=UPI0025FDF77C|nr:NUDIX hydrolase [Rhodoplanes sp.]
MAENDENGSNPTSAMPPEDAPDYGMATAAPATIASRLTDWLNRTERDMSFRNVRPRDAATLILIDRSEGTPKVLLGRRHAGHKFMPDKFVFPGGRVEPADRGVPAAGELDPRVAARLMAETQRPSLVKARAFAIAAVRETFEETGLLLGRADAGWPEGFAGDDPLWGPFAQARVLPDLSTLQFIARAITPPRRPRRFDARFFAVDAQAIAARVDDVVSADSELVELVWMPLDDAERLDISPITKAVLAELDHRIAGGFKPDLPVPFYRWLRGRFVRTEL